MDAVPRWPDVAIWTVSVLDATDDQRHALLIPELPSVGLLTGETYTHSVVSLAAYGRQAVLVITVEFEDLWDDLSDVGGTIIAAVSGLPDEDPEDRRSFGLWSSGLVNPVINWADSLPETLRPVATTSVRTQEEAFARLVELNRPQ